jgi:UDP-N-acetylglucosamine:LPS N-acetylglucosamine transferase
MIDITGVRGKSLLSWLKLPFKLLIALIQCAKAIKKEKPDIVEFALTLVTVPPAETLIQEPSPRKKVVLLAVPVAEIEATLIWLAPLVKPLTELVMVVKFVSRLDND